MYRFGLPDGQRHSIEIPDGVSSGGIAIDQRDGRVWVENCVCPDR